MNENEIPAISTDIPALHQKSEPVEWFFLGDNSSLPTISHETEYQIEQLLAACPEGSLGLAAPQIGILQRFFVASLQSGRFLFINPKIHVKHKGTAKARFQMTTSTEGCLSLPGVTRCVERYYHLIIEADLTYKVKEDKSLSRIRGPRQQTMSLHGQDSFVVQHEYDHLDGILIIDLPEAKTTAQKHMERRTKRRQLQRQKKVINRNTVLQPLTKNPKKQAKLNKKRKAAEKFRNKSVKIRERIEFEKKEAEKVAEEQGSV